MKVRQCFERRFAAVGGGDLVVGLEDRAKRLAWPRLVVDHENASSLAHAYVVEGGLDGPLRASPNVGCAGTARARSGTPDGRRLANSVMPRHLGGSLTGGGGHDIVDAR